MVKAYLSALVVLATAGVGMADAAQVDIAITKSSVYASHGSPHGWFKAYDGSGIVGTSWNAERVSSTYLYADVIGAINASADSIVQINSATVNFYVFQYKEVWEPDWVWESTHKWQAFGITGEWAESNIWLGGTDNTGSSDLPPSTDTGYGTAAVNYWGSVPQVISLDITALVQAWADGQANNGVAIKAVLDDPTNMGNGDIFAYIRTVGTWMGGEAPSISVDYTLVPVPEASTLTALGAGVSALMLRRRK